ncbi:MAG: hypothetical protein ABI666_10925 [Ferruginibacter sp.]
MKKNFFEALSVFLLSFLLISGCKKVTEEELMTEDPVAGRTAQDSKTANTPNGDNGCQLRAWEVNNGYSETFRNNRKGLVDRWRLDYADGYFYDYFITYNRKDLLLTARMLLPGDAIDYNFYTDGKHITRCTGYRESNNELANDIFYIYNNKGQMIRLVDQPAQVETRFYYDNKGYNRRSDMYINNELFYTYLLNYDIPGKNPYLALNGIDFGFPNYIFMATQWDKRWNSSGTVYVYDNGNPIVIADDDPVQTVIHTGNGNYVTYAKYFDIPTESFYDMTFSYSNYSQNSNGENIQAGSGSVKQTGSMNTITRLKRILTGYSKNMKQELIDFKNQCLSQLKPRINR